MVSKSNQIKDQKDLYCNICEEFKDPTPPIHVDQDGFIIDDGTCPEYLPEY